MRSTALTCLALAAAALTTTSGCRGAPRETFTDSVRQIRVPEGDGTPVMTDGMIQPGEWDDATVVTLGSTSALFLKRYRGHLFVGVDGRRIVSPTVDLFFSRDDAGILQLHRSAQLGERVLSAGAPDSADPEWVWGRTSGWYANEGRWIRQLQDSLMRVEGMSWNDAFAIAGFPSEIGEFDILTSKLGPSRLRFRVTVEGGDGTTLTFPAGTASKDTAGWATLILN